MARHTTLRLVQPDPVPDTKPKRVRDKNYEGKCSALVAKTWKELVIGQDAAIDTVAPYINRYLSGLSLSGRPVGNIMLMGPTGSGKTHAVESLAKLLHDDKKKLLHFHCAEYTLEHEVAKILGSPPGYLGHKEQGSALTQKKLTDITSGTCDLSIVLFDEIEKAHYSLFKLLLGVMDKGTLSLGTGEAVNFEKTILFFTSNLGASQMMDLLNPRFGFEAGKTELSSGVMKALNTAGDNAFKKSVTPEFANRLDERIVFKPLSDADLLHITEMELAAISKHIKDRLTASAFDVYFSHSVVKYLTELGADIAFGARSLKRVIVRKVFNMISDAYLDQEIHSGDLVRVYLKDGEVAWKVVKKDSKEDEPAA